MAMFKGNSNPSLYIVNTKTNEIRQIVDCEGHVVGFEDDDEKASEGVERK
jgi:hypothetical protein